MAGTNDPSVGSRPAGKAKFLLLGSPDFRFETLMSRVRSLNLEHVSSSLWNGSKISRRPSSLVMDEATMMAHLRRWFFSRKPDAGFVLMDFPATLLQAKMLDEWLESRNEALSAVVAGFNSPESVVRHYCTLGLIDETEDLEFA